MEFQGKLVPQVLGDRVDQVEEDHQAEEHEAVVLRAGAALKGLKELPRYGARSA